MKQPSEQYFELYRGGVSLEERNRRALYREYKRRKLQRQRLTVLSAILLLLVAGTLIAGRLLLKPENFALLASAGNTVAEWTGGMAGGIANAAGEGAKSLPFVPKSNDTSRVEAVLEKEFGRYSAPSLLYDTNIDSLQLGGIGALEASSKQLLPMVTSHEDIALKHRLEALIASFPPGHFSPYFYYYNPQDGTYVEINGYKPVSGASVIKLPVLYGWLKSLDENTLTVDNPLLYLEYQRASGAGELQYKDANVDIPAIDVARNMIQISDNTCTNMLISAMGGASSMNRTFRDFGLRRTRINQWLPDLEGSNQISTYEMATILNNIDQGATLSQSSRMIGLDILRGTHNNRLLPAILPKEVKIAHKTGDIGTALGDSGIFYLPDGRRYIISVQVDRPYNDYTARDMIQQASLMIYEHVASSTSIASHPNAPVPQ